MYRDTLDYMIEGCAVIGFDWSYIYVNESYANYARLKPEDLIGKNVLERIPDIKENFFYPALERCMKERTNENVEGEFKYQDNSAAWFEVRVQPVPEGILLLAIDRTARKRFEEAMLARTFELKETQEDLNESKDILKLILDNINEGIIVTDAPQGRILAISKWALNDMTGISAEELRNIPSDLYLKVWDFRDLESGRKIEPENLPIALALKGKTLQAQELQVLLPDGSGFIASVNAVPIFDADDSKVIHAVSTWTDITVRKNAEKKLYKALMEKEVLLREVYHRTKNNLQLISSLMSIKSSIVSNPEVAVVFNEMQNRIRAIALVHEKLCRSDNLEKIDLSEYARDLVSLLIFSSYYSSSRIQFIYDLDNIFVDLDTAVPCGLIITELLFNAVKHAFPGDRKGIIEIKIKQLKDSFVELVIKDDGIGFKNGSYKEEGSFGLLIIRNIAEKQLKGTVEQVNNNGATWKIKFKYKGV